MIESDNKTIWCGNLPEQITEELLYELFLQKMHLTKRVIDVNKGIRRVPGPPKKKRLDCVREEIKDIQSIGAGPLESVRIAKEKNGRNKNFAFITYNHEVSVPYALNLLRGTTLFNRTIAMKCRGRMALLPPPIRCFGPDPSMDFSNMPSVVHQFANMADNLREKELIKDAPHQRDSDRMPKDDRLVMASLQGNWSHRHHPYRGKEMHNRDNYRSRDHDNHRNRDKPSSNWRDRRYNKKPHYHRRE